MKWLIFCLIAGAVSACGFAPLDLWPLTLAGVAFLLVAVERSARLRGALACGWWFGLGQFVVGLNWIATAFTYQSNMPAWLGWVAVVLLSLYLAVYPAVAAGLAWRWAAGDRLRLVLVFAAAWIVTEFLRAVLFTGFPWNPLGVSLLLTPAAGFSTLVGTYGLSGLAVLAAGALFLLFRRDWRSGAALGLAVAALAGLALLVSPAPQGEPGAHVRIVQPNIDQTIKYDPAHFERQWRRLEETSVAAPDPAAPASGPPARLILWPEVAVPEVLSIDEDARMRIAQLLRPGDVMITGASELEFDFSGRATGAYNSVIALDAGGRIHGRYDKSHLVPYGEYLPMRPLLTAIGLSELAPSAFDTLEGPGPRSIQVPGFGRVGVQICYEIVFSGAVIDRTDRPSFLFNPSNDAWFGRWGPPQHLAQARMRAIEEGLPVLRSTPTGISAVIDARGNLAASIPWREQGVIDARVPPAAAPTLFARAGNIMPFLFALLLAAAALLAARLQLGAKRATEPRT
jgi:apolipoprotein N-acyltransferase